MNNIGISASTSTTFDPSSSHELEALFYEFISHITIDSKDEGPTQLRPFQAQKRFLNSVFEGLENDIHWHVVLKARQLGMTTISLALDIFWISMFKGLQGALITDTPENLAKMRVLNTRMLESLPDAYKIPVYTHNREGLVLRNGSSLDYISAGVRKNGGLGRSRAYNFLHATECSSWGDEEGLESLTKSLTMEFPARLYIFESTARGYNLFHSMWEDAKEDTLVKKATFIGWWAKDTYRFDRIKKRRLFEKYSSVPISDDEASLIKKVQTDYGWKVTLEQLAWYRHEKNPANTDETTLDDASIIEQELPWHEEQAFMLTGQSFFSILRINEVYKDAKAAAFKGFRYWTGNDFLATQLEQVKTWKQSQLKIWSDPHPEGRYVIGADPAYGSSDEGDSFVIQVCRCYADGLEQVAEYCTKHIQAYQFAWILFHICGFYNNGKLLLELNGPGEAVFTEIRNLQLLINNGYLKERAEASGIRDVVGLVRNYIFTRIDNIHGGGGNWQWKTNQQNKLTNLTQMKDMLHLGQLTIRSIDLLEEMRHVVQNGLEVRGEGKSKDDRTIGMSLAVRAWMDSERKFLIATGRTREMESKRDAGLTQQDLHRVFMEGLFSTALQESANVRKAKKSQELRKWRGPPRRSQKW